MGGSGNKAYKAACRLIGLWTVGILLIAVLAVGGLYLIGGRVGGVLWLLLVWLCGAGFIWFFFREPRYVKESDVREILSPAYGLVDVVEEVEEPEVMEGRCKRVSIFLSIFDVHVQKAPVSGRVSMVLRKPGKFMNALRGESARVNENVLIGLDSSDVPGCKVGIRLIAGVIARRIVPFVTPGENVVRGQTISLIQFGSRVDVYLPLTAEVLVRPGDRVRGSGTVLARI